MELKFKKTGENCSRCHAELGFRKKDPYENTDYDGYLCKKCFEYIEKNYLTFLAEYIDGISNLIDKVKGKISIQNFDDTKRIIFSVKKGQTFHIPFSFIQKIEFADYNMKQKKNLLGKDSKLYKQCLQVSYATGDEVKKAIFLLHDDKAINAFLDLNASLRFGGFILKASGAEYYGGHKKFLAGGVFGKFESGTMYLTKTHLVFLKSDENISKRWEIVIPLKSIIINRWTIEEESRRKDMAGGGSMIGGSGIGIGGGAIHESGKAHHIVVPYLDEHGIPQEPRFGVSSFGGKAIREWSSTLYELVVKTQKDLDPSPTLPYGAENKSDDDPLKVLKLRFAKGEIIKEEFEDMRKTLE